MTVRIRLATESDAQAIAGIYRPFVEDTAVSFEIVAPDADEMAARLRATLPAYPWIVCDVDGVVGGYAYASLHHVRAAYRWSVNVSVYVARPYWRVGMGRGLYHSLFAILRAQRFYNAYAGITLPNAGSVGLHEAMGFERVGVYRRVGHKFRAWHDVGWWQLALRAHDDAPAEPIGLDLVRTQPDWPAWLDAGVPSIRL